MPCKTPGVPKLSVAEVCPSFNSPPASAPINLTSLSLMKGWNMPMALEPPPTQATTASGRQPAFSSCGINKQLGDLRGNLLKMD